MEIKINIGGRLLDVLGDEWEITHYAIPQKGDYYISDSRLVDKRILQAGYDHNTDEELGFSEHRLILKRKAWKPKYGEVYYFLDRLFRVDISKNNEDHLDMELMRVGNCFKEAYQANQVSVKVKQLLKESSLDYIER